MTFETITYSVEDSIAIITINRPEKMNALNYQVIQDLRIILGDLRDNDQIRVVILTGAGEKAFVAGADIAELNKLDVSTAKNFAKNGQEVMCMMERLGKPTIAAVNGFALGGGCEMAIACTLRVASENAKFGQPEVNLGVIPGYGGTQRLVRLIGKGRAMEMILTGDMIDSETAKNWGLVNIVCPPDKLLETAKTLARKLIKKGPVALEYAMEAVHHSDLPLKEGLNYETALFALSASTDDAKEGTRAFLEKRQPDFKGK